MQQDQSSMKQNAHLQIFCIHPEGLLATDKKFIDIELLDTGQEWTGWDFDKKTFW